MMKGTLLILLILLAGLSDTKAFSSSISSKKFSHEHAFRLGPRLFYPGERVERATQAMESRRSSLPTYDDFRKQQRLQPTPRKNFFQASFSSNDEEDDEALYFIDNPDLKKSNRSTNRNSSSNNNSNFARSPTSPSTSTRNSSNNRINTRQQQQQRQPRRRGTPDFPTYASSPVQFKKSDPIFQMKLEERQTRVISNRRLTLPESEQGWFQPTLQATIMGGLLGVVPYFMFADFDLLTDPLGPIGLGAFLFGSAAFVNSSNPWERLRKRDLARMSIASTMGGIVFGTFLGSAFELTHKDLELLVDPVVPPAALALLLGGVGYGFANSIGSMGFVVQGFFAAPTLAITDWFVESVYDITADTKDKLRQAPGAMTRLVADNWALIVLPLLVSVAVALAVDVSLTTVTANLDRGLCVNPELPCVF